MTEGRGESITRNTGFALVTQLTTAAFTAVLTLYLARALGPTQFGVFALAMSFGGLVLLPADLGISQAAARFIAERHGEPAATADVFHTATRLKLIAASVVMPLMIAAAGPLASAYGQPDLAWAMRGIALSVFGQAMLQLYSSSAQALRRNSVNFRIVLSKSALEVGASIAIVAAGGGAAGAAFGRAAGYLFGAAVGLVLLRRLVGTRHAVPEGGRLGMGRIARYGSALVLIDGAFALFGEIDVLLIGALLTASAAGIYQAAAKLVTFLHYPGNALAAGVAPQLARVDGAEPDIAPFQTGLRYLVLLQTWLAVGVLVWATPVIHLLLGPRYAESTEVLRALAPFVFLSGIGPLVSVTVNYLGEARRRLPIAIATVAINAAIDLALIPKIGVVAGAVGTDVAYLLYVPAHLWICKRLLHLPLWPLVITFLRALLAGAAMAGVLALFGTGALGIPAMLAGGLLATLAYVATLVLAGELTAADAAELRRRLPDRLWRANPS